MLYAYKVLLKKFIKKEKGTEATVEENSTSFVEEERDSDYEEFEGEDATEEHVNSKIRKGRKERQRRNEAEKIRYNTN